MRREQRPAKTVFHLDHATVAVDEDFATIRDEDGVMIVFEADDWISIAEEIKARRGDTT